EVSYYDPFVPEYSYEGETCQSIPALTADALEAADLVMVTTAHTNVNYELVSEHASLIFDTKNVMKHIEKRDHIRVL
ncbi:MAG: UDP-N-acetyl-D-glucosamine dehydrogenase, partial [Clostridia bacterium]